MALLVPRHRYSLAYNSRCLPNVELSGLKIKHYDGKSL